MRKKKNTRSYKDKCKFQFQDKRTASQASQNGRLRNKRGVAAMARRTKP